MEDALDKSSYEELVQEPMSPHSTFKGQSLAVAFSSISSPALVAKSGEKGPLICGFSSSKLISITWSK